MTSSFNPMSSSIKKKKSLISKSASNEFRQQNKKEKSLLKTLRINSPYLKNQSNKSTINTFFTQKYKNMEMLLNDEDNLLDNIVPASPSPERRLKDSSFGDQKIRRSHKKRRHVIEGLADLGIYDTSRFKKKTRFNIPIRILSKNKKISLKNSFDEKAIKLLLKKKGRKAKDRKLPDMDNFARPLVMFQRIPAVPNRMGHSILMSLNKMFGGKLNIKIPPQPPVIMVNQTPYYSTI